MPAECCIRSSQCSMCVCITCDCVTLFQAYATLLFWWQLFNAWSGSNPIDGINLTIFNLVYTSLPIMVVGVADQDLLAPTLLREKHYYSQGRLSSLYTHWKFGLTVADAIYQSCAVFFLSYGVN